MTAAVSLKRQGRARRTPRPTYQQLRTNCVPTRPPDNAFGVRRNLANEPFQKVNSARNSPIPREDLKKLGVVSRDVRTLAIPKRWGNRNARALSGNVGPKAVTGKLTGSTRRTRPVSPASTCATVFVRSSTARIEEITVCETCAITCSNRKVKVELNSGLGTVSLRCIDPRKRPRILCGRAVLLPPNNMSAERLSKSQGRHRTECPP